MKDSCGMVFDPPLCFALFGANTLTEAVMLGHADAGFTLRTYTHTTNRQQAEAADMMGSLMTQSL